MEGYLKLNIQTRFKNICWMRIARVEDRNHFEALIPRIYELGGKLPDDI